MSKVKINEVTIGTDFELLVVDHQDNFVSAIPFIEGTKEEPQPVSDKGHFIQHDGVLAEFNCPPVLIHEGEDMWGNIQFVLEEGSKRLPENLKLKCCTNASFTDAELTDPEARIAGCSPSFAAWDNGEIAEKPDFGVTNERCAGFHWHFAWKGCSVEEGMRFIRLLDGHLALPLLFIDEDKKRRLLYGRMGDFRYKDYGGVSGIEYRVLSNVVVKNKEIFNFVWSQIKKAFEALNKGIDYLPYKDRFTEAINNYNLDQADQLCRELGIERLVEEEIYELQEN